MDLNADLGKVVGAASAPVALVIASAIFLSNLTSKYIFLSTSIRQLTDELRKEPEGSRRSKSLELQLPIYRYRIRILTKTTFWLGLAIICFLATVLFTGFAVIYPDVSLIKLTAVGTSFMGSAFLVSTVVMEMLENRRDKDVIALLAKELDA